MPLLATRLWQFLPLVIVGAALVLSLLASMHAIVHKRDPRAAVSWTGLIWLVPFGGAMLYITFGVNRIQRRAGKLRQRRKPIERMPHSTVCGPDQLCRDLTPEYAHLESVARVGEKLTGRPLLGGNKIGMLVNGEQAYPEMLKAIRGATRSVALLAYIFEADPTGQLFIDALVDAQRRGCAVRVLVDYVGSHGAVAHALRKAGVPVSIFLRPRFLPFRNRFMNLRNHRKILACDGTIGFTGGMNIRQSHMIGIPGPHHEQDTHFRLEGPVVRHLVEAFADDWAFATDEILSGVEWFPPVEAAGPVNARGVAFDPGEQIDLLRLVVGAAISTARSSIKIVSPYFIPEQPLITSLNVAALRGIEVDIVIPSVSDSRVVQWATQAMLWQVLVNGCRVWTSPAPFDHSKLLLVDDAWVFFGSANMDTRSMRLNFEFNVEAYCRDLAATVGAHIDAKIRASHPVTLKEMDGRTLALKLRDGLSRLFSPYL
ncbi:MAG TPA: phospholipase D-like domain-containing protein [Planctomycetota bacterium]|nr:phospholipase D-like domain-containing protein [Planctomycetota bacterium]